MLFRPTLVERLRSPSPLVIRLLVGVLTLLAISPFFLTLRPPLQDFPQHLAAGHVLLEPHAPELRFDDYFQSEWLGSQYLGIYVLIGLFYYPLSWFTEQPLLLASRLSLLVLAVSWTASGEWLGFRLLRRSGFGVFFLVLFFNAHLILGFLNFLLGVAFCFVTLWAFADARARRTAAPPNTRPWVSGLTLGMLSLATFYFHVVPFGMLLATVAGSLVLDALLPCIGPQRKRAAYALPLVDYVAFLPSVIAMLAWLFSPAGQSTRQAAQGGDDKTRAMFTSAEANTAMLDAWLMDVFRSPWDTKLMYLAVAALLAYVAFEWTIDLFTRRPTEQAEQPDSDATLIWLLRLGAPACVVAYYVTPASYDWIWPINARFPLLAVLLLPFWLPVSRVQASRWAWLPRTRKLGFVLFFSVLSVAAAGETVLAREAFRGFANEMDGLDDVLTAIPKGRKVATLVFDRGSRFVAFSPFLHVGAYYQAERGGVSYFSFNDFPQSPVRFLEGERPPKAKPRWEWKPEAVRPDEDLAWFDYLIVRGGPTTLKGSRSFTPTLTAGRFRVFKNTQVDVEEVTSP